MSFRIDSITNYFSSLISCVIKPLQSYITLVAYKAFPSFKQLETENRALKGQLGNLEILVSDQSAQIVRIQAQIGDVVDLLSERNATIARLGAELIALNSRRHFSGPA
jgi:hypothetical protein